MGKTLVSCSLDWGSHIQLNKQNILRLDNLNLVFLYTPGKHVHV